MKGLKATDVMQRDLKIYDLKNTGFSFDEIAKQLNLRVPTVRYGYNKIIRLKENDPRKIEQHLTVKALETPDKVESANLKLPVDQWSVNVKELIGGIIAIMKENLAMERHTPFNKLADSLETLVKLDRLMSGRSTENIFKLDVKSNMSSSDMLKALNGYREKNITVNEE